MTDDGCGKTWDVRRELITLCLLVRNTYAVEHTPFRQACASGLHPFPGLECREGTAVAEVLFEELAEETLVGLGGRRVV